MPVGKGKWRGQELNRPPQVAKGSRMEQMRTEKWRQSKSKMALPTLVSVCLYDPIAFEGAGRGLKDLIRHYLKYVYG